VANLLPRDRGALAPVIEPIYHYTSADGLLGAPGSRRLWASQATSLNDRAEVEQGWRLIIEIIDELLGEEPGDSNLELLRSWAKLPIDQPGHVTVLCASLRGDDANQWRLYGGGSRGFAIELDPQTALSAVVAEEPPPRASPEPGRPIVDFDVLLTTGWLRVIYRRDLLKEALRRLWTAIAAAEAPQGLTEDDHAVWWSELQAVAFGEISTLAHLVKTEGFSGEYEVRFVVTHLGGAAHFKYRAGTYGIVGFRELGSAPAGHNESKPKLRWVERSPARATSGDGHPCGSARYRGPGGHTEGLPQNCGPCGGPGVTL
jgi:hypothetical protein